MASNPHIVPKKSNLHGEDEEVSQSFFMRQKLDSIAILPKNKLPQKQNECDKYLHETKLLMKVATDKMMTGYLNDSSKILKKAYQLFKMLFDAK